MQRIRALTIAVIVLVCFVSCANAATRMLMQAPAVTATLTLSRAGQSDRCVGSLSLKGADGKPIAAAIAKVQWAGAAAPATISTSPKVPGRLFSTGSSQNAAAGCELQLLEVTVAGVPAALSAASVTRRQITW